MITGTRIDPTTGVITRFKTVLGITTIRDRNTDVQRVSIHSEPVGTTLKARIENLISIQTGKGCGCQNLARQMDSWGIAGCERRRSEIVEHLVSNRDILESAIRKRGGFVAGLVAGVLPDAILREGANWLLSLAIEDVRNMPKPARRQVPKTTTPNGIGSRPAARFVFEPKPEWTSTTRHLTYHIWPTAKHDGWKWNLQQLAQRWQVFNGVKVLGVAVSKDAHTVDDVIAFARTLGMTFDHIVSVTNNKQLREVATWPSMLRLLNPSEASHSEVVFSAHAKGVRHDNLSSTLEAWARIMYAACLDDWPTVDQQLHQYLATGCFKRYNNFRTPGNDCWHYSGTFFWWRLKELGQRDWQKVDRHFYGTESWLGLHCKNEETGCLFLDEAGDLYNANYLRDTVIPLWEQSRLRLRSRTSA